MFTLESGGFPHPCLRGQLWAGEVAPLLQSRSSDTSPVADTPSQRARAPGKARSRADEGLENADQWPTALFPRGPVREPVGVVKTQRMAREALRWGLPPSEHRSFCILCHAQVTILSSAPERNFRRDPRALDLRCPYV